MGEKLKPCPFCRGTDIDHTLDTSFEVWVMVCSGCGAIGPPGKRPDRSKSLWNTRPEQADG